MQIDVTRDIYRLAQVFTISRGSRTEAKVLTAHVSAGGVTGRGECVPYARYGETLESVEAEIAGLPADVTREALQDLLPPGAARNAVDCALWDWEAKRAGRRVWELAGLPAPGPMITAYTLSLDTPEAMRAQAAKNAHRPLLKIKLGTPDDMPRVEAVRAGAPEATIIADANEGWSAEVYSDLAPHLVRLGVALVEQPMPAGQDGMLAEIERPLPVCADESCHDRASLPDLRGKYDMVNIKLDKTGGLTEALALKKAAM
ncbi:MAG: dipeptide epimerase, partial [Proteobacteria bacterium]|nr:dipeptide epimerase [Pseudomonadota bacterium]